LHNPARLNYKGKPSGLCYQLWQGDVVINYGKIIHRIFKWLGFILAGLVGLIALALLVALEEEE
jgi:hypothetical protein